MASAKSVQACFDSRNAQSNVGESSTGPDYDPLPTNHDQPPQYSANISFVSRKSDLLPVSVVSPIDFSSYRLPHGTISDDKTTCTTTDPELTHNAATLFELLQEQAALPPKPIVRIRGTHIDWVYSWGNTRTDFDLTLDIMPLILPTETTPLTYMSVKARFG